MNSIRCTTCGNPDVTKDGEYYICSVCGNKFLISSVSNNQNNTSNNEASNTILIEQYNEKKKEELLNYIKSHNLEEISEQYIKDIENTEFDDSEKKIIEEKINQLQSIIENALEIKDYKFSIEQYVKWKNLFSDEFKTKLSNIVKETNFHDDNTDISDIRGSVIDFFIDMLQYSNDLESSSLLIYKLNYQFYEINRVNYNDKQIIINDIIAKLKKINSNTNFGFLADNILTQNFFFKILTNEQKKEISNILFNVYIKYIYLIEIENENYYEYIDEVYLYLGLYYQYLSEEHKKDISNSISKCIINHDNNSDYNHYVYLFEYDKYVYDKYVNIFNYISKEDKEKIEIVKEKIEKERINNTNPSCLLCFLMINIVIIFLICIIIL